ncbi:MAG: hypothetical protein IJA85_04185 [Clostridia bacterium]|nr:hypothetical protein [Clostridia bacterium]
MKKISTLILALLLVLFSFAGCSGKGGRAVMEYGDYAITEEMYAYWMVSMKSYFLEYYADAEDTDEFWSSTLDDGSTMEEYVTEIVNNNVRNYLIAQSLFDEYGITLTQTALDDINLQVSDMIDYYGSRAEANAAFGTYGINLDILEQIVTAEKKLECVYDFLYGDTIGIEKPTDEELDTYYKANYMRIKYIYINLTDRFVFDENGNITYDEKGYYKTTPLTEEEIAEKRTKVENALSRANAGENFDALVEEFTEVDMSLYPNGLYISNNDIGNYGYEVISAVMDMQTDEIRLVEDAYDAYIILKCPLVDGAYNSETDSGQFEALSEYTILEKYDKKFDELAASVVFHKDVMAEHSLRTY